MSDTEVFAVGLTGAVGECDHNEGRWGTVFVKGVSEEDHPSGPLLFIKAYCKCGARVYGQTRGRPGDIIKEAGDGKHSMFRLVRDTTGA